MLAHIAFLHGKYVAGVPAPRRQHDDDHSVAVDGQEQDVMALT